MQTSLIVVDDLFDDPMAVRQRALTLGYPVPEIRKNFAYGRESEGRMPIANLDPIVSKIVNEPVAAIPAMGHGRCRLCLEGDDQERPFYVHLDPGAVWSGLLYLTLPEFCQGGTEFYRHKVRGTDRAAIYTHEFAALGAGNFREANEGVIRDDSTDMERWEFLMSVPMRFNRLVLLRPWLWHAAGPSFGTSLDNGRLVMLLYWGPASAQNQAPAAPSTPG